MKFQVHFISTCFWILAVSLFIASCKNKNASNENSLFVLLSPESSGVDFINKVTPDANTNILTYEYIYNGGGVGVGDFNNDGFQDIFLAGSQVPGKLYLNKGKLEHGGFSFADATESSGITGHENWAFGVSIVDINDDGFQDIYLNIGGPGNKNTFSNRLYINQGVDEQGNPGFEEMAGAYGLADRRLSIQSLFFDYDKDGDLDMYLLTGGGFERSPNNPSPIVKDGSAINTDRLYRNDFDEKTGHPVFTDVSKESGIVHEGYGLGVSLLDINEDGWLDIYVTNDYLTNDLLYINNGNGSFSEKVQQYFRHTSHFAMGNDVGDINNDGLMDIIAVDMLPDDHYRRKLMFGATQYNKFYYAVNHGYTHQYMRNTLQLNNGNGSFSEIGQLSGIYKTDWSWSVLLADFDNDEFQDIFITNGFGKDVTDLDFVKFRSSMTSEVKNEAVRRKVLLDSLAKRPGIKVPNYAYQNKRNLRFSNVTEKWGFDLPAYSNGASYADFDNDGDLDLVVSNIDDVAHVYQNQLREKKPDLTNYLKVKLSFIDKNETGIGSKVTLKYQGKLQSRIQNVIRGFQSSVEDHLHFGVGTTPAIDTILVQWPDGKKTIRTKVKANQLIELGYNDSLFSEQGLSRPKPVFTNANSNLIPFRHIENNFVDFNHEPLLPHKLSQEGPGMAVGDINNDGLEDLFVGGALLRPGGLFVQRKNGTFESREFGRGDLEREDMGCVFFDADQDDDLDLYVVSGGNEYNANHRHYQDRLYINDGKGNFQKDVSRLPSMLSSGSCVTAADYDHDGDLDLFVGGRVLPGSYPMAPRSYILQNDGGGKFADVTKQLSQVLQNPGMVTSGLWTDFDNDGWVDLLLVGEYMPVSFYRNNQGKSFSQVKDSGLADTEGWWKSVTAGDFDNDGDVDYVAGNFGLNSHYRASAGEPINVAFKDFDNNGAIEAITSYYEDGVNYPTASMDVLTNQLPLLKRKILFHRTYAHTSTTRLLEIAGSDNVKVLYCKTLESAYIENTGNGKFVRRSLPLTMQFAPVYGVQVEDVDLDGNLDFIAVGNSYAPDVVSGRCDAFIGQVMLGDGAGNFKQLSPLSSGFYVEGDAKSLVHIQSGQTLLTLAAQNNDSLKIFEHERSRKLKRLNPSKKEITAVLTHRNGKTSRQEIGYGDSYLSQSSRRIWVTPQIKTIKLFDLNGKHTRTLEY